MAKNQNTFEKRRREVEKKQRAEEKRKNRQKKKDYANEPAYRTASPPEVEST
ncbi:MAG: hypothetical protein WD669_12745 [Pirellulales bacterium]